MQQYKACFFDLYGTLVDIHTDETRPSFWKAVADFYTGHGAAYTGKELRGAFSVLCAEQEEHLRSAAGPEAEVELDLRLVFAALYQEKGVPAADALIRETAVFFRQRSTTHLRLYAGAKELLAALRENGIRVILLSNAQSCFTIPELEALDLMTCFDRIWISSDVGYKKPDIRFFLAALGETGLEPSDCLMIGNDPVSDAAGAKKAGMDAIYIHSGLSPKPAPVPDSLDAAAYLARMDLKALKKRILSRRN